MTNEGWDIVTAVNGYEAIEFAAKESPDDDSPEKLASGDSYPPTVQRRDNRPARPSQPNPG